VTRNCCSTDWVRIAVQPLVNGTESVSHTVRSGYGTDYGAERFWIGRSPSGLIAWLQRSSKYRTSLTVAVRLNNTQTVRLLLGSQIEWRRGSLNVHKRPKIHYLCCTHVWHDGRLDVWRVDGVVESFTCSTDPITSRPPEPLPIAADDDPIDIFPLITGPPTKKPRVVESPKNK
jgi:hypothetical protein